MTAISRTTLGVYGWVLVTLFLFTACGDDAATADATTDAPASAPARPVDPNAKPVPRFDADSAYAYVAKQVAFGPRVMNTPAHEATGEWLIGKLKEFGAEVETQEFTATAFDGTPLESTNIIGRYRPEITDRILLGAHWDTRPFADSQLENDPTAIVNGADDGASGVGVLLEIARQLGKSTPNIGVDIIFFDAEDYGQGGEQGGPETFGLGSQHYARALQAPKPRYGILLDMVGGKDAKFRVEQYSQKFAPEVVRKVWSLAAQMNFGDYFVQEYGGGITDDHYFVNTIANVPMIDIIAHVPQTTFPAHWHTGNDNMDVIDRATLRAAGQVVIAVVYREAAGTI